MKNLIFIVSVLFLIFSCTNDDDICVNGEATPRMKLKFKDATTLKLKTLDSIFVDVDYGNGRLSVINNRVKTDSLLIPIRVDENNATEFYVATTKKGTYSKIKVNYITKSEYVSPACGVKKLYENLTSAVITANPVKNVEVNQTEIINENKTHIYLLF